MFRGIVFFMMIGGCSPYIMSMEQESKESYEECTDLDETFEDGDRIIFLAKKRNMPQSHPVHSSSSSFVQVMQQLLLENKKILNQCSTSGITKKKRKGGRRDRLWIDKDNILPDRTRRKGTC